ncbi:MAG: hypothetical protein Q9164_004136 [Protoblastenia rupestris]
MSTRQRQTPRNTPRLRLTPSVSSFSSDISMASSASTPSCHGYLSEDEISVVYQEDRIPVDEPTTQTIETEVGEKKEEDIVSHLVGENSEEEEVPPPVCTARLGRGSLCGAPARPDDEFNKDKCGRHRSCHGFTSSKGADGAGKKVEFQTYVYKGNKFCKDCSGNQLEPIGGGPHLGGFKAAKKVGAVDHTLENWKKTSGRCQIGMGRIFHTEEKVLKNQTVAKIKKDVVPEQTLQQVDAVETVLKKMSTHSDDNKGMSTRSGTHRGTRKKTYPTTKSAATTATDATVEKRKVVMSPEHVRDLYEKIKEFLEVASSLGRSHVPITTIRDVHACTPQPTLPQWASSSFYPDATEAAQGPI